MTSYCSYCSSNNPPPPPPPPKTAEERRQRYPSFSGDSRASPDNSYKRRHPEIWPDYQDNTLNSQTPARQQMEEIEQSPQVKQVQTVAKTASPKLERHVSFKLDNVQSVSDARSNIGADEMTPRGPGMRKAEGLASMSRSTLSSLAPDPHPFEVNAATPSLSMRSIKGEDSSKKEDAARQDASSSSHYSPPPAFKHLTVDTSSVKPSAAIVSTKN